MPRGARQMALAKWFRMSGLARHSALRREPRNAQAVPMQRLPQANVGAGRNSLRFEQAAAAYLVCGPVSPHAIETGDIQPRAFAPARDYAKCGVEDEAQARAGHIGAQRDEALEGQGSDG
jgi:hypothetical protein